MQEFSKEKIEIDGTEYTLFINRKGILSWENITKASKKAEEAEIRNKDIMERIKSDEEIDVEDNANPFDYSNDEELDRLEAEVESLKEIYIKFYWIVLEVMKKIQVKSELFKIGLVQRDALSMRLYLFHLFLKMFHCF